MENLFRLTLLSISAFMFCDASANDSTARVGTGGIVLLKNTDIRMAQEVLEISTKAIRVSYVFENESKTDIYTTVAFPMPTYGWNPNLSAYDINDRPLRGFKVLVDGNEIPTRLERKALFQNRDITEKLRKIGLTDTQIFDTFADCDVDRGCGLSKKQSQQIAKIPGWNKAGLVWADWKVAETIYWQQAFPAGRGNNVQHDYKTFVGHTYTVFYHEKRISSDLPLAATANSQKESDHEACLDDETRKAIDKRIASKIQKGYAWVSVTLDDVEYVLGTGRNWKGPIRDFKLKIIKESADQMVSLCFPGKPKKLSPTVLEFSQENFLPQDKLVLHFYTIVGSN